MAPTSAVATRATVRAAEPVMFGGSAKAKPAPKAVRKATKKVAKKAAPAPKKGKPAPKPAAKTVRKAVKKAAPKPAAKKAAPVAKKSCAHRHAPSIRPAQTQLHATAAVSTLMSVYCRSGLGRPMRHQPCCNDKDVF